uniref:JAB domain-containing protein n=1 Tax=Algoriphagus locisalis TaxID=305507 RepID=UPI00147C4091
MPLRKSSHQVVSDPHNHPNRNLLPSEQDKRLTANLVKKQKALDMPILDHLIVNADRCYSFASGVEL